MRPLLHVIIRYVCIYGSFQLGVALGEAVLVTVQRPKGAHALTGGLFAAQGEAAADVTDTGAEFAYLHRPQAQGVVQACAAEQRDEAVRPPEERVDFLDQLGECIHVFLAEGRRRCAVPVEG